MAVTVLDVAVAHWLGSLHLPGLEPVALTRTGDWVFLECNPNGQWAWLEESTGLPMTAAFADLLERGAP